MSYSAVIKKEAKKAFSSWKKNNQYVESTNIDTIAQEHNTSKEDVANHIYSEFLALTTNQYIN